MLTKQETLVIKLIGSLGLTNKEISTKLNIAEATVKVHVKALMQKLRLKNRTQLAIHAIKEGMVSVS